MLFSTQPVLDGRRGRSGTASGSTTSCFLGSVIVLQCKFLALRVHQFMQPFCQNLKVEEAHLLLMNQNYRLIKHVKLSQGGYYVHVRMSRYFVDNYVVLTEQSMRKNKALSKE